MVETKETEVPAPWSCSQVGGNEKLTCQQLNEVIPDHCFWDRFVVSPNTSQNHSLLLNANGTVLSQPTPTSTDLLFTLTSLQPIVSSRAREILLKHKSDHR